MDIGLCDLRKSIYEAAKARETKYKRIYEKQHIKKNLHQRDKCLEIQVYIYIRICLMEGSFLFSNASLSVCGQLSFDL